MSKAVVTDPQTLEVKALAPAKALQSLFHMPPSADWKSGCHHTPCDLLTIKMSLLKPSRQSQVLCKLNTGINVAFFGTSILPAMQALSSEKL